MAYTFSSDQHGAPLLVAGVALPTEMLTLYSDDSDEEKLAMRGFWQSLHVYSRCWLVAEPLDCSCDYYKCRLSSSRKLLLDRQQSFFSLLSQEQLLTLLNAPDQPIEWEIVSDGDGNEYPVNVYGWETSHWQCEQQPKASSTCQEDSSNPSQPEQKTSQKTTPSSLTDYKERKSEEPIDTRYEQVTQTTIHEAMKELYPEQVAAGEHPHRKYFPLILVKAVQKTLEQ